MPTGHLMIYTPAPKPSAVLPRVRYLRLQRARSKYVLAPGEFTWLDSGKAVRRAWPQLFAHSGYGLSSVGAHLGIAYKAHDAREDARCTGLILLHAIADTGLSLESWLTRVNLPIDPDGSGIHRDSNPEGYLAGEVIVFTGAAPCRGAGAADAAAAAACRVAGGVKSTRRKWRGCGW
jgi:DNA polymerase-3 subunit epsilon